MLTYVTIEGRKINAHSLKGEKCSVIFDGMMGSSHNAISVPAPVPNQSYRQTVKANVIANLFKGARVQERRNAVDPRAKPFSRKSGRHRDHILLGDAGIHKPLAHLFA